MDHTAPNVNLLKKNKQDFIDRFINWALNTGRFVVILTESIALFAFLYRFSLDRQVIDLHDKIKQKQGIVKLLQKNEDTYRGIQNRISVASSLQSQPGNLAETLTDIINLAPPDVYFNRVAVDPLTVRLDANVGSIPSLTSYIQKLKSYPKILSVSLDKIQNKSSIGSINILITATLKKTK